MFLNFWPNVISNEKHLKTHEDNDDYNDYNDHDDHADLADFPAVFF